MEPETLAEFGYCSHPCRHSRRCGSKEPLGSHQAGCPTRVWMQRNGSLMAPLMLQLPEIGDVLPLRSPKLSLVEPPLQNWVCQK